MFIKGHLFQNVITILYYLTMKIKQVSFRWLHRLLKEKMTNKEEVLKWNHSWAHNLHHKFFIWVSDSIRMPKVSESIYLLHKIQV